MCIVLCGTVWYVRIIGCGVCVLACACARACLLRNMGFRVLCNIVGVVDVVCRCCVLRCGISCTMWCIGDGGSRSMMYVIIDAIFYTTFLKVPSS